jgi:uncharacterized protein YecE (DUF72 family)
MVSIANKPLLLIEDKIGLGIIQVSNPIAITLKQFSKLRKYHEITESDRIKWWPSYDTLYAYTIIKSSFFKKKLYLDYKSGPQIVVSPSNIFIKHIFIGTAGLVSSTFKTYPLHFIEINYSFYRFPGPLFISKLKTYGLKYSIKVNQSITHFKKLSNVQTLWKKFYDSFVSIHDQIVCFIFQFSKKFVFSKSNMTKLKKLSLNPKHNYVFEFRESAWFNNEIVTNLFKEKKWTQCIVHVSNQSKWADNMTDGFNPKLSKVVTTSDMIYVRLHGTKGQYIGSYSNNLLSKLIELVRRYNIHNIIVVFNNTDDGYALKDSMRFEYKFNTLNLSG